MVLVVFVSLFFAGNAQKYPYSNNYHFVYIELYGLQSKLDIIDKMKEVLGSVQDNNDSLFLFLSNGEKPLLISKYSQINDNLYNTVFGLETGLPNYKSDIERIIEHWNTSDFLYMNNGDVELKYSSVTFHYFVSSTSLKNYWDLIIDRLLKINNIALNYANTENFEIQIYINGDKDDSKIEDAKKIIDTNIGKEYKINFITY
jgi:hypothetical protein